MLEKENGNRARPMAHLSIQKAGARTAVSSRLDQDTTSDPVSKRANREGRWSQLKGEKKEQQDSLYSLDIKILPTWEKTSFPWSFMEAASWLSRVAWGLGKQKKRTKGNYTFQTQKVLLLILILLHSDPTPTPPLSQQCPLFLPVFNTTLKP